MWGGVVVWGVLITKVKAKPPSNICQSLGHLEYNINYKLIVVVTNVNYTLEVDASLLKHKVLLLVISPSSEDSRDT